MKTKEESMEELRQELRETEDLARQTLAEVESADPEAVKRVIDYLDNLNYDNVKSQEDAISISDAIKELLIRVVESQSDALRTKFLAAVRMYKRNGLSAKKSLKLITHSIDFVTLATGMKFKDPRKMAKKCVEEIYGVSLKKSGKKKKKK